MRTLLAICPFVLFASPNIAQSYLVDFEDFQLQGALFLDVSENLVLTDVGGSGIDVTLVGGSDSRIYDLVQFGGYLEPGPQAFIDMDWNTFQNFAGTDILFSSPVGDFSVICGDFGGDDDSPMVISAYDGAGNLVDSDSANWNQNPPFASLSVGGGGIVRVHYSSGGSFTNSTFIDDLRFTPDGPRLGVSNLVAGAVATAQVDGATPSGIVVIGYSLLGAGPTSASIGACGLISVALTNPLVLAIGNADATGGFQHSQTVPTSASGVQVWLHAADLSSCEVTNPLALVVQ